MINRFFNWVKTMGKYLFWKATMSIMLMSLGLSASEIQVGTLSEGSCWYEYKDSLKVASFNDKSAYMGTKEQIEAELEGLIAVSLNKTEHPKIVETDLALHCGGYGTSLVARVTTDSNTFCVWTKFDKGLLSLRSIGVSENLKNAGSLCDGHKWGQFIMGVNGESLVSELQTAKWATMIKEITPVSSKVVKVVLMKDYEFREQEVIDQLQQNFSGKNLIRYIEFNDYRHPVGEFTHL